MTQQRVIPAAAVGTVHAPPSKSYTHRGLVAGHLSGRRFRVRQPLDAEDTRATAVALGRLGTRVDRKATEWTVTPSRTRESDREIRIDCRESGTTLRFISAVAALSDRAVRLDGSTGLSRRPIDELLVSLRALGCSAKHVHVRGLPLLLRGPIHGGRVRVDASQSSQFASALMMVLPTLTEPSTLSLSGRLVSRPYLDATLAVLDRCGVGVHGGDRFFEIPGGQRYQGREFEVPGDASSAAYLWAAAAVSGGRVRVDGVPVDLPQADLAILDLLVRAGARVTRDSRGATVEGGRPRPFRIDLTDSPDLYPLAGVIAATTPGTSELIGASHVALKESDRRSGTIALVRALGARVETRRRGLRILGTEHPKALRLARLNDHRLVMSAAVGALATSQPSQLGDARAVRKSYPRFWSDFGTLVGRST